MICSSSFASKNVEHFVSERMGSNHTRMQSRSLDMAHGKSRSAQATAYGVLNRSTTQMKSTFFMARYRRGASWPMLAMGFADWIHSMRTGRGSPFSSRPVSMASRMASDCDEAENPYFFRLYLELPRRCSFMPSLSVSMPEL